MTKVKRSGAILWVCTTLGCIGPFPDEGDDETSDDDSVTSPESGGSEVSGPITVSGPFETESDGWTSMGSTDSMGTTEPWPDPSATATSVSGTATCGDCTDSTTGSEGPPQVCGVEIEHDPYWNNTYICGCEACNVQFDNLVPSSGEALLAECECICYEVGCGGSVSGGATSGIPDDDTGWGTEDTGGTIGTTDPGSASEPTTAGSEDSGAGSDDTDPTG